MRTSRICNTAACGSPLKPSRRQGCGCDELARRSAQAATRIDRAHTRASDSRAGICISIARPQRDVEAGHGWRCRRIGDVEPMDSRASLPTARAGPCCSAAVSAPVRRRRTRLRASSGFRIFAAAVGQWRSRPPLGTCDGRSRVLSPLTTEGARAEGPLRSALSSKSDVGWGSRSGARWSTFDDC